MITKLKQKLRFFRRDEDGSALVIEFVIFVPLIFNCFLMSAEMGMYAMNNMFLDRGLNLTVRHIRLHTNDAMDHDLLKTMICDNAGFLDDCDSTLRLEMKPLDPRNFAAFDQSADCVDLSKPVEPVRGFTLGQPQELMILRACVKFNPVFPTSGLGYAADTDESGRMRMVATAAFVQEP